MDELKIVYKLYALEITKENIRAVSASRFCRITPFYILIYTDGERPENAVEITATETHRLTKTDEQWLTDCNIAILVAQSKKHEYEIAADLKERLERLEQALDAEAGKTTGGK